MPSESTASSLPQPSEKTLAQSPQKVPFWAAAWENPRPTSRAGRWHIWMRHLSWAVLTQGGEKVLPQAWETSLVKTPRFRRLWRSRPISASTVMRPNLSTRQHTSSGVMPWSRSRSATRWAASSSNCW